MTDHSITISSVTATVSAPAPSPATASTEVSAKPALESQVILNDAIAPGRSKAKRLALPEISDTTIRSNKILVALLVGILGLIGAAYVFTDAYDNDIWFIMATGREIVENGIPYDNPFTFLDGMKIVVQQWVVCVINYEIYEAFGFVGLGVWVFFLYVLFVISAFIMGRVLRKNSYGSEIILIFLVATIFVMRAYMTVRPHLYSMIAFTWIITCCEMYIRTSKIRYLVITVLIAALHVNFQAALAPFDIAIILFYAIPDLLAPFHKRGRLMTFHIANSNCKHWPFFVCVIASAAALLANPYFLNGAMYLINSYGSADYGGYISEMGLMSPAQNDQTVTATIIFFAAAIAIGYKGLKDLNIPLTLLACLTVCMSFDHLRNYWLGCLFCFAVLCWASSKAYLPLPKKLISKKILCNVICVLLCVSACVCMAFYFVEGAQDLKKQPPDDASTPTTTVEYLNDRGFNKDNLKVFATFNAGGYLEFYGYKVMIDPRPEIWSRAISQQDFEYYEEYTDTMTGSRYFDDYISKYDFDVLIVNQGSKESEYLGSLDDYSTIPSGKDYVAYAKRDLIYERVTG